MATDENKTDAAETVQVEEQPQTVEASGTDEQNEFQTTDQQAEKQDALPDEPEKVEEQPYDEEDDVFDDGEFPVEAVVGSTIERNVDGEEYEVPYVLVTGTDVAGRTSDSDDPARSWTAQEASGEREDEDGNVLDPNALVPVAGTPGQTFRVRELPSRESLEAAGVNYEQWVAGLPIRPDVPNEEARKGIPA